MTLQPNIRYFVYARKSSEAEDRQVASIEAQVNVLRELARTEGLELAAVLSEAQSAKSPGRPVFNEMLKRIRAGEARGILCWKLDRLARNPIDGGEISWLLQQSVIQHIRTHERHYYPTDNVLMMAVELGMANQYIRDLSQNVKRGLKAKCEKGWRPGVPPLGYRNSRTSERGSNTILTDPDLFPLVRKMFDLVLSGVAIPRVLETANQEWGSRRPNGKPPSRSTIYEILGNHFYCGVFEYPRKSGNWYRGSHERMITEEEYDRVQAILGNKGRPRRGKNYRFALRGLIRCGECGAMVTAEQKVKRQKNGNVHLYAYYHCTKRRGPCSQRVINEKELETQVLELLDSIAIPPEFHEWALIWLREKNMSAERDRDAILAAQRKAYDACVQKIDALIDMRAASEITEDEFAHRKTALTRERLRLGEQLNHGGDNGLLEEAKGHFSFAERAKQRFEVGGPDEKWRILADLGSNPTLKNEKLDIALRTVLFPIRNAAGEVRAIHARFEPLKTDATKEEIWRSYARSPVLLAAMDAVRTCLLKLQGKIAA